VVIDEHVHHEEGLLATLLGVVVFASGCSTTAPGRGDPAAQRVSIDAGVDNALETLFRQEPSSRELVTRAKAVLVFPAVLEAGFVFGASRGDGALRVGGRTVSYHRTTSGTFGLQAGAQSTAVFLLFMTDDALARFRNSRGWTTGVDASVTLLTAGANAGVSTSTVQQPVIGYVLSNQGLMAGMTIDGTRITRLQL
jgi:lipid-binding SYLF domain-containing protein